MIFIAIYNLYCNNTEKSLPCRGDFSLFLPLLFYLMTIAVFDDMQQCCESEVQRLLESVSCQRREEALRFKFLFGRFACLKSFEMLSGLLKREHRITDFQYARTAKGKPYLLDCQNVFFNISHCKKGIAVAVSDREVGIDIETFHEPNVALLKRVMNENEQREISQSEAPMQCFSEIWTQKEAVLKLRGTGIVDDLTQVLNADDVHVSTRVCREKGYVYSVASFR